LVIQFGFSFDFRLQIYDNSLKPASENLNNLQATINFNIKLTFESRKQQSIIIKNEE